jgi:hypothetical protein
MQPDPFLHVRWVDADVERLLDRRALERAARAARSETSTGPLDAFRAAIRAARGRVAARVRPDTTAAPAEPVPVGHASQSARRTPSAGAASVGHNPSAGRA